MALSLSSHFPLASPLSASFSSLKPTKTLVLTALHRHHTPTLLKPILGISLSHPSPINNIYKRHSFNSSVSPQEAVPTTNDEEGIKVSEGEVNKKHLLSLKTLFTAYKEALFYGDLRTVSDIEAMIHVLENQKNELEEKVSALLAEITSGKEKYIRLQADFDNFRKRSEKERTTTRSDAQGELIESLLPMVDSFERAKQQIKPETEKEKKIDTSYQGIYKQFVEILRSLQVAAIATVGKPFNPSLHEAIAREESQEFSEGIVIQELRRGFLLGDRLLRPAMVKVSAGPGRKKVPGATKQPTTAAGVGEP
ncbi:uncharacterized protein LOC110815251 [Carica papaya]|uniref:uncharacterized protein LOC110815251 n=1 Tax=Carica papaya TaxID=3649 RepID=UPI000B8CC852|nr:uncharacterized protein LOC110815251 [Carica papaya]